MLLNSGDDGSGGDWSSGLWLDRDNQSVVPGQDTAVMSTNGTPIHSQLGHHTKQILGQEDVTKLGQ